MIPPDAKCCHVRWSRWDSFPCLNKAKVERDGKFYCGVHDPERLVAVRVKNSASFRARQDAYWQERKLTAAHKAIADAAIRGFLPLIDGTAPAHPSQSFADITTAVQRWRELGGKVDG